MRARASRTQVLPVDAGCGVDLLVHTIICSVGRHKRSRWHESEHRPACCWTLC